MNMIFKDEIDKTIRDINAIRRPGDLCFAAVSDTRLTDTSTHTRANILAVDQQVHFDFLVHLGDILCGESPEQISRLILREELSAYRETVASKKLYVTQGETDGWRNESYRGQLVTNIMTDEAWHQDTAFIDQYANVKRVKDAPYYYVDDVEKRIRCIFLASERYEIVEACKLFQKYHTWGLKQLVWLEEALKLEEGWQVILFSHAIPQSVFETGKYPPSYKGNAIDKTLAILQSAIRTRGIQLGAWITGHYGYDCETQVLTMNQMVIGSLSCFPSPGVEIPGARRETERTKGTEREDLWDAFVLQPQERKLYAFRFGAGIDRVIDY